MQHIDDYTTEITNTQQITLLGFNSEIFNESLKIINELKMIIANVNPITIVEEQTEDLALLDNKSDLPNKLNLALSLVEDVALEFVKKEPALVKIVEAVATLKLDLNDLANDFETEQGKTNVTHIIEDICKPEVISGAMSTEIEFANISGQNAMSQIASTELPVIRDNKLTEKLNKQEQSSDNLNVIDTVDLSGEQLLAKPEIKHSLNDEVEPKINIKQNALVSNETKVTFGDDSDQNNAYDIKYVENLALMLIDSVILDSIEIVDEIEKNRVTIENEDNKLITVENHEVICAETSLEHLTTPIEVTETTETKEITGDIIESLSITEPMTTVETTTDIPVTGLESASTLKTTSDITEPIVTTPHILKMAGEIDETSGVDTTSIIESNEDVSYNTAVESVEPIVTADQVAITDTLNILEMNENIVEPIIGMEKPRLTETAHISEISTDLQETPINFPVVLEITNDNDQFEITGMTNIPESAETVHTTTTNIMTDAKQLIAAIEIISDTNQVNNDLSGIQETVIELEAATSNVENTVTIMDSPIEAVDSISISTVTDVFDQNIEEIIATDTLPIVIDANSANVVIEPTIVNESATSSEMATDRTQPAVATEIATDLIQQLSTDVAGSIKSDKSIVIDNETIQSVDLEKSVDEALQPTSIEQLDIKGKQPVKILEIITDVKEENAEEDITLDILQTGVSTDNAEIVIEPATMRDTVALLEVTTEIGTDLPQQISVINECSSTETEKVGEFNDEKIQDMPLAESAKETLEPLYVQELDIECKQPMNVLESIADINETVIEKSILADEIQPVATVETTNDIIDPIPDIEAITVLETLADIPPPNVALETTLDLTQPTSIVEQGFDAESETVSDIFYDSIEPTRVENLDIDTKESIAVIKIVTDVIEPIVELEIADNIMTAKNVIEQTTVTEIATISEPREVIQSLAENLNETKENKEPEQKTGICEVEPMFLSENISILELSTDTAQLLDDAKANINKEFFGENMKTEEQVSVDAPIILETTTDMVVPITATEVSTLVEEGNAIGMVAIKTPPESRIKENIFAVDTNITDMKELESTFSDTEVTKAVEKNETDQSRCIGKYNQRINNIYIYIDLHTLNIHTHVHFRLFVLT